MMKFIVFEYDHLTCNTTISESHSLMYNMNKHMMSETSFCVTTIEVLLAMYVDIMLL